ncbi:hypothetical protein [Limnobaculum xujianqingii]|uniref:hypothetical protein n=1 Tax=Limnobaculum xujianqingii TaxID=2738837 RepID=UPI00112CE581|nr:hypothetical protein [Limnobaculum xujianqingii]
MSFKYPLGAIVKIKVSGEEGHVKGRADYAMTENQYYIHYQANDGRAVSVWFDESDIEPASIENAVIDEK